MKLLKRWTAQRAIDYLVRYLRHEDTQDDVIPIEVYPEDWDLIEEERIRLSRGRKLSARQYRSAAAELAKLLDILRQGNQPPRVESCLSDPDFRGNREHLARLLAGSGSWENWRQRTRLRHPDLRGAFLANMGLEVDNLRGANLQGADLSGLHARTADFRGANLRHTRCRHADFSHAQFDGALWSDSWLVETLLTDASLQRVDLRRSNLLGTQLNHADVRGADFRDCALWGVSIWNIKADEHTKQSDMKLLESILIEEWATMEDEDNLLREPGPGLYTINSFASMQVVSQFVSNGKIGSMVDGMAEQTVLLLGRFTAEPKAARERSKKRTEKEVEQNTILEHLEKALLEHGYIPVIFDFPPPKDRDLGETIALLAGLARFIVADFTDPRSVALEAQLIIPTLSVPFVPILRADQPRMEMFESLQRRYEWVQKTVRYTSVRDLISNLEERVIRPAEQAVQARRASKR